MAFAGNIQAALTDLMLSCFCLAVNIAYASDLTPGGSVSAISSYPNSLAPVDLITSGSGISSANPLLAQTAGAAAATESAIDFEYASYTNPATGYLEFFYQIQNVPFGTSTASDFVALSAIDSCALPGATITGVDQITSATFTSFDGFVQPSSATNNISSVSLDSNDQDLTIKFDSNLTPGQSSAILVIETNALACNQNGRGAITGGSAPARKPDGSTIGRNAGGSASSPEPGVYVALPVATLVLISIFARRGPKI